MTTGGNTTLDPSRQSDQLRREGSLANKEPLILTPAVRQHQTTRANTTAETQP